MSKNLVLIIKVKDSVYFEDIICEINGEVLCRLEEDDRVIKGWEWLYND